MFKVQINILIKKKICVLCLLPSELGTRQYCRDNVTMFSGHMVVSFCTINIFGVAIPFRHRDLNIFRIFLSLRLFYIVALSLSRNYKIVACPALPIRSKEMLTSKEKQILAHNDKIKIIIIIKLKISTKSLCSKKFI